MSDACKSKKEIIRLKSDLQSEGPQGVLLVLICPMIDCNCDVLPLLKFCTNKPILALLLRHFFGGGGKGGVLPQKRL